MVNEDLSCLGPHLSLPAMATSLDSRTRDSLNWAGRDATRTAFPPPDFHNWALVSRFRLCLLWARVHYIMMWQTILIELPRRFYCRSVSLRS